MFYVHARRGRQSSCIPCKKEYNKAHYISNKDAYLGRAKATNKEYTDWYRSLKDDKECTDCKVRYPYYVLEWDHLPGTEKEMTPANAKRSYTPRTELLKELEKCELVCANCHRIRTHKRHAGLV